MMPFSSCVRKSPVSYVWQPKTKGIPSPAPPRVGASSASPPR